MTNVFVANSVPKNIQWWGIGREAVAGTIVAPSISIPLDNGMPTDQPNMLTDRSLRGDMGTDYNIVLGTEMGAFPLSGDVYLDSIGHLLYNLFGEYTAAFTTAGSAAGSSTTSAVVGATTLTGTAFTAALPIGTLIAIANPSGPSEVVVLTAASTTTTLTFANTPLRFNHASAAVCTSSAAGSSVTHTFKLLNPGGSAFGLPANAQPITHTITHYNGLSGSNLARQYAYWCAGAMDFTMDTNNLFQHNTRGSSLIGVDAAAPVTNSQGLVPAQPGWRFQVGVGGPASGGTLVQNIENASVSPVRELTGKFALVGQQAPIVIGRYGLSCTGKLTYIANSETPLTTMLNGTQQQLQIAMTNGLTGNQLLGITFNFTLAQFEAAQLADPDMMAYDVGFRALMNTTDAGLSGGRAPMSVSVVNTVPTY